MGEPRPPHLLGNRPVERLHRHVGHHDRRRRIGGGAADEIGFVGEEEIARARLRKDTFPQHGDLVGASLLGHLPREDGLERLLKSLLPQHRHRHHRPGRLTLLVDMDRDHDRLADIEAIERLAAGERDKQPGDGTGQRLLLEGIGEKDAVVDERLVAAENDPRADRLRDSPLRGPLVPHPVAILLGELLEGDLCFLASLQAEVDLPILELEKLCLARKLPRDVGPAARFPRRRRPFRRPLLGRQRHPPPQARHHARQDRRHADRRRTPSDRSSRRHRTVLPVRLCSTLPDVIPRALPLSTRRPPPAGSGAGAHPPIAALVSSWLWILATRGAKSQPPAALVPGTSD